MGIGTFFEKLWNASFGRVDTEKARKINAAFGSFLLFFIAGLGVLIGAYCLSTFGILIAAFIVGTWESFATFLGIVIITIWGTTEGYTKDQVVEIVGNELNKASIESKEVYTKEDIERIVMNATGAALNKFIENNTQMPSEKDSEEPEPPLEGEPDKPIGFIPLKDTLDKVQE